MRHISNRLACLHDQMHIDGKRVLVQVHLYAMPRVAWR
jgi:hypothetical protein